MSTVYDVVRNICLDLPETEEVISHGFPSFKVNGKSFATYSVNHHGDQKVALLLNMDRGTQEMLVSSAPDIFYVPPYSGTKGWVGVELNKGLKWDRVSRLILDAYCRCSSHLLANDTSRVRVKPPTETMRPEDIDPLQSKKNLAILNRIRDICISLPEVTEDTQFGNPNFRAGKKGFCLVSAKPDKTTLQIWVGRDRQLSLTSFDQRYEIPAYIGHNGWINFNLTGQQNWKEISELIQASYEHFALKRMLKKLAESD